MPTVTQPMRTLPAAAALERRDSRLRELRIVIGVEVTMWARENGLTSHARSTTNVIITLVTLVGAGIVLLGLTTVLCALLIPDILEAAAGPIVLLCQVMMLGTALSASSASSRANAQFSPYRRLYVDALRVPEPTVVFVRGQLLPLIRLVVLAIVAVVFTIPAGPLPLLLPGTLALAAVAVWCVLRVVPLPPGTSRVGVVAALVAAVAGVLLGLLFRAVPTLWSNQTPVLAWLAETAETLRWAAQVTPAAAIVILAVAGGSAWVASRHRLSPVRARRTARTWPRAFLAMTARSTGRGSVLLRRTAKPLAISVAALAVAAAIAPGTFTGDHAVGIGLRAVPLVVAMLVVTALSSFFGAMHVLPMLNLAARYSSVPASRTAVAAYLGVLTLWIVPGPVATATALFALTGDVRIIIVGATTAIAAVAGLLVGSLFDRFALTLPDGTIELSLWGHTLTGLVPTLLTVPGALGGTVGMLVAGVLAVLAVFVASAVLIRRIRPL
ncbi:hypothetical protein [Microbacterium sp.]|uniref:hypothetical protein n=1 Tax=Microbacterium sp. TaxID=51671 RepID=UPI00262A67BB|nr:hypothetical protein [Microbacterium sp.]